MRILIVAGGTGGHLFPAIRLAEEINLCGYADIIFVTSRRRHDREILREKGIAFKTLPIIPFQSGNPLLVLNFVVRLMAGTIKSLCLLFWFRPSVVVGFGGYLTGPLLLSAALLKRKTVIHEQNVYPGKANRILAGFVDRIAVSFPETVDYLRRFSSKIVVSGNPLRRELKKEQKAKDNFTILAMGGSQGSRALNRLIPEAIGLVHDDKRDLLEIIHIAGYNDKEGVKEAYNDKEIRNRVFSFREDIAGLYSECDFVIGRAGATTVSELLYLAKPSILIPYPHGDGHQRLNAKVLEDIGNAILLEEEGLKAERLRDAIVKLMDKRILAAMSERARNHIDIDACNTLIKAVIGQI